MTDFIVKCKNEDCGIIFKTDNKSIVYCSPECAKEIANKKEFEKAKKRNDKKYGDIPDIPTCKICGYKSPVLIQHLSEIHNIKQKTYLRKYKAKLKDIYHSSYTDEVKVRGKGIMANCKECGKEFEKITPRKDFCSDECNKKHNKRKTRENNTPLTEPRKCRQCGKEYMPKSGHTAYCSAKCRNRWFYEKKKKGKTKSCRECGKEMSPHTKSSYCGLPCKKTAQKKRNLEKLIRESKEKYKDKPEIPTCNECGFRGALLARHITAFHNMTLKQYCKKYNVTTKDLEAPWLRKNNSKINKKLFEEQVAEHLKRHKTA